MYLSDSPCLTLTTVLSIFVSIETTLVIYRITAIPLGIVQQFCLPNTYLHPTLLLVSAK